GYASLVDQQLAGRFIGEWSPSELEAFCQRYNIGWVVCWSPSAMARLGEKSRQGTARRTAALVIDGQPAGLFTLKRTMSFVLKGQARWLQADSQHIVLGDVQPEDGKVVLSLHHHARMQASPHTIQVERDPDPLDPIPLIRLRLSGPASRV